MKQWNVETVNKCVQEQLKMAYLQLGSKCTAVNWNRNI